MSREQWNGNERKRERGEQREGMEKGNKRNKIR